MRVAQDPGDGRGAGEGAAGAAPRLRSRRQRVARAQEWPVERQAEPAMHGLAQTVARGEGGDSSSLHLLRSA